MRWIIDERPSGDEGLDGDLDWLKGPDLMPEVVVSG